MSSNRTELEKVINHYKYSGEKQKLKAAYFLISNMPDKYYVDGDEIHNYDSIFTIFNSYHKRKKFIYKNSPVIRAKWDSILNKFGNPAVDELDIVRDYDTLKANFLIDNIDQAFRWYQTDKNKNISFDNFCEYLLPYRILREKPEDWRNIFFYAYKPLFDTIKGRSTIETVKSVNISLEKILDTNYILWEYPFDISASNMLLAKRGSCLQIIAHTALIFRAHGIPVGIDYTPLWGDRPNGHYWNTLLLENGENFPFEGATIPFKRKNKFTYRISKAYRMTFALQDIPQPDNKEEVPEYLLNRRRIDVTHEYNKCYNIKVKVKKPATGHSFHNAVICTYAKTDWKAQSWGSIKGDYAYFKNMGSDLAYIIMYYYGNQYIPASNPFILQKDGNLREIIPDYQHRINLTLTRKNPNWTTNIKNIKASVGSKIQGANRSDFKDSVTLFKITHPSDRYEKLVINSPQKFKYVRFLGPEKKNASVAEVEFYGKNQAGVLSKLKGVKVMGYPEVSADAGTPYKNAFDNDPGTYFMGGKSSYGWAGLELPHATRISYVRYCPRNDTNFIIIGDKYELKMWNGNNWISLGTQIAHDQQLKYFNIPSNTLLLLHDMDRGHEERIFTYENGKQVWW
ncbi:transglutaminase domain-containing protein [Pedobacter sp. BS3]|uniref:transglutaminase-like domain-containing protein n=1 Tax=Pedobacter sp. BS3 TaxID=2567937 RepID=UPI00125779B2|nr:transglutaminase-like domain-containing protein [Pedobacter sp. BS3]TZF82288.1 transglutaminase domain-containing protein [Pedobacter sp. BS3]